MLYSSEVLVLEQATFDILKQKKYMNKRDSLFCPTKVVLQGLKRTPQCRLIMIAYHCSIEVQCFSKKEGRLSARVCAVLLYPC